MTKASKAISMKKQNNPPIFSDEVDVSRSGIFVTCTEAIPESLEYPIL